MNLATEENTHVFLLSSERRDLLMRWLGDTQGLENIGLAAEDGYCFPDRMSRSIKITQLSTFHTPSPTTNPRSPNLNHIS